MKKLYRYFLIATLALCAATLASCKDDEEGSGSGSTSGQQDGGSTVLLNELFNGSEIPSNWTLIDADGDGFCWEIGLGSRNTQSGIMDGIDSSNCATSASWDHSAGTLDPDNYLVSPEIYIPTGGYTLSWYDAAQDADYPADRYTVYAGTLSGDQFSPIATLHTQELATDAYTLRSVSLDAYKQQNIRIAFRHHDSQNNFMLKIDNVKIAKGGTKGPSVIPVTKGVQKER